MVDEQHNEDGMILALGAISEVLNKQNAYLESLIAKQEEVEEEEEAKKEELQKAKDFDNLVKAVAAVLAKEDSKESAKKIDSKPEDQQKVIQAAEDENPEEEKKEEDEEANAEADKEYPEVEKLKKENAGLKQQLADLKKNQDAAIEAALDSRLRKMGWKREDTLRGPIKVNALGADTEVKKSTDPEDRIAQLAKLSYKDLKNLEIKAETDDLPPEIKQLLI